MVNRKVESGFIIINFLEEIQNKQNLRTLKRQLKSQPKSQHTHFHLGVRELFAYAFQEDLTNFIFVCSTRLC